MYLNEEMNCQDTALILAVLLLATSQRMAESCRGPGPRFSTRHPHKTQVALVYRQHIPNMSEKTIGASGPAEGKIRRSDTKFKDLVVTLDQNVVFRNEEGTGADRMMTKRCQDRLKTLALMVVNRWPKVKLRVIEAWDEDGNHGRDSLHYEGRAVDLTTDDRDEEKYGMLARMAVNAGFDWVFYESKHHIHASVIADDEVSMGSGCFPKDSTVTTHDGEVLKMDELKVGDKVLTYDRDTGARKLSDVILMMHENADTVANFVKITARTENGHQSIQRQVTLTKNHLIYKRESTLPDRWHPRAVFAEDIQLGDYVYLNSYEITNSTDFAAAKVTAVHSVEGKGVFAPLTAEGSIIVDGVAASSYAVYHNEYISHALFYPLRLLWRWGFRWSDQPTTTKSISGVHWYPGSIFHIANAMLPRGSLNP